MLRSSFLLTPLLLAAASSASALTLSLSDIAPRVQRQNPDLTAARLGIDEARGRLLGAGRLANPEAGFDLKHDPRFGEGAIGLALDQKFPITARLRLEKQLSAQLVTAAELEVRDTERKIIAEAQSLAVKLLSIEQQRALRKQQTELATKLADFAKGRAAVGELSALDAAQAQVDAQRLLLESRKLETERVSFIGELKPKLGLSSDSALSITGTLPAMKSMAAMRSWEQRADYQLARLKEDASLTGIDLARSKKWEDLSVGAVLEGERMEDAPDGLGRTGFLGFRISIPLPLWNKNEGEIAEKTASAERAKLETKALGSLITNEAQAALDEMKANAALAAETKDKLLPLVVEQTAKLEKAYETGQADLFTVLRARDQRLQLEAAVLDATRDYHLARIRYEAATRAAPAPQPVAIPDVNPFKPTRAAPPARSGK